MVCAVLHWNEIYVAENGKEKVRVLNKNQFADEGKHGFTTVHL